MCYIARYPLTTKLMPREFPDTGQVEMSAKVPKELYDEFIGFFPQHGASSWFIRTALTNLIAEVSKDVPAVDRVREAIRESIRQPFI